MKVSYNWLKQYVDLSGIDAYELAHRLTHAGLEVEQVEPVAYGTNLIIGQIVECNDHPDSDHLHVCKVDVKDEILQIVCGAPNARAGIKVIVAKVGAKLKEIEIKASKIRNVESYGMLCSIAELGVNEKFLEEKDIAGIAELPSDAQIGDTEVLRYLGLDDYVLDISQTPNRSDFMAMFSVAKEVGAIFDRQVTLPKSEITYPQSETDLKIEVLCDKCQHFLGRCINNVVIKPSPKWMQDHLHAAGIKAINNVVDISNYVMLETGQPLHFYDLHKLPAKHLAVEMNHECTYTALDGIEYKINKDDLVITSDNKIIGIAGIMGGEDSKIDENTQAIIIEAAHFNHVSIRNSAKRFGLNTEASSRFIKGIEPLAQIKAMKRAVELLVEYADASGIEAMVESNEIDYQPVKVTETLSHCNQLLGTNYTMDQVIKVLKGLDFDPVVENDSFTCTIPSYRLDIAIAQDLDEEIIRLIGYETLPSTLPKMVATVGELTVEQKARRTIKNVLCGMGLNEVINYTLVSDKKIADGCMPLPNPVTLASPMSEEIKNVRSSLMPSMLECLQHNQSYKNEDINIYEISNVYGKNLVQERLAILLSGNLQASKLNKLAVKADFYTLKGVIEVTLKSLGYAVDRISYVKNEIDIANYHPYRSCCLYVDDQLIGIFGEVHPNVCKKNDISTCMYAEINLEALLKLNVNQVRFKTLAKYPSVKRDIALVVRQEIFVKELIDVINDNGKPLVQNVEVFDVYQGEHVEQGYKSVALSIVYQSFDHTLKDSEINEVHTKILEALEKRCNANLRK